MMLLDNSEALEINPLEPEQWEYCISSLNDYRDAWPLIREIQQQPKHLIELMKQASPSTLQAFKRISSGRDWSALTDVFLIKNNHDLALINREHLINFLRQAQWMKELTSYTEQAVHLMSLAFLTQLFRRAVENEIAHLRQLQHFLAEYPCAVRRDTVQQFVAIYWAHLGQKDGLSINKEFMLVLDQLIQKMPEEEQSHFTQALPLDQFIAIMDHALDVHDELDSSYSKIYERILFFLATQSAALNREACQDVRKMLLNQALGSYALEPSHEGVLSSFRAAFISPRFMANTTTTALHRLVLSYRCLLLTFNHKEFQSLMSLEQAFYPYYKKVRSTTHDSQHLNNLLHWCIERSIHALLSELIRSCYQSTDQEGAVEAIARVYDYYGEQVSTLRSDLLFAVVDHLYGVHDRESRIGSWINQYLPSTYLAMPPQNQDIYCYDGDASCRVFVDESNRVWLLTDHGPCIFHSQPAYFYNQEGMIIGCLTETGYFRHASPEFQELSARLLSAVPMKELGQSPAGLSLLMASVFLENTIALFYSKSASSSSEGLLSRVWFERHLTQAILDADYLLPLSTWDALVAHVKPATLFSLWASITDVAQARSLFHSLLKNDITRELLFSGEYDELAHDAFQKQGISVVLADYILCCHDKSWFVEGLIRFPAFVEPSKVALIVRDAFEELRVQKDSGELSADLYHQLLLSFTISDESAYALLSVFCGDEEESPVQTSRTAELNDTLAYFTKEHLIALCRQLNQMPLWEGRSQFRLALFILQGHHEHLFAKDGSWNRRDLNELAVFINRHLEEKNAWDNQLLIGYKMLGALLVYSASLGQTTLFFKEKNKIARTAAYTINPILLAQLVDKLILPSRAPKGTAQEPEAHSKDWRIYREQWAARFRHDDLVQGWHTLIMGSYKTVEKKLPIICPYLLHYSGAKKPINKLLKHYFDGCYKNQDLIHPVSELMQQFPDRAISAVIFDALQRAVIKNPQAIDLTILEHMARFYVKKTEGVVFNKIASFLLLLTCWGQEKQYALVEHCCRLLLSESQHEEVKQQLRRASVEARVEPELEKALKAASPWYRAALTWFTRLWNYGFNWKNKTSNILVFCDENPLPFVRPEFGPLRVSRPMPLKDDFGHEHQHLIDLLAQVQRSSFKPSSLRQHGLFLKASSVKDKPAVDELASQEGLAKV